MINMFQADLAFSVELLAIGLGVGFIIWGIRYEGAGANLAKVTGYFIAILAFLSLLCTSYYTIRYWESGYYSPSHQSQCCCNMSSKCRMMSKNSGIPHNKMRENMMMDHQEQMNMNNMRNMNQNTKMQKQQQ